MDDQLPATFTSTRRVERARNLSGAELLVDGQTAQLVDLSPDGAQFTAPEAIRPNQLVRLTLTTPRHALRLVALVAWSTFEMPTGSDRPHYRVGVVLTGGDVAAIDDACRDLDAPRS